MRRGEWQFVLNSETLNNYHYAIKRKHSRIERPFTGVPKGRRHLYERPTVAQKAFFAPDEYRFGRNQPRMGRAKGVYVMPF